MNAMPKFVASTTLRDPEWENTSVLDRDLGAAVTALKDRYDGDILIAGSARLVQSLLELDLVDELRLMVFPVVLGKGTRLFGETSALKPLRLVDSTSLEDGVFVLTYRPAANGADGEH
jgi:dihydrofolate reductase